MENVSWPVPQAMLTSESNEWYTPEEYASAVRDVLGRIDIDPASNALANGIIQAALYYDIHSDGFSRPWHGRCFLNPPYGMTNNVSNAQRWSQRLVAHYEAGAVREAILLVKASPGYHWFSDLLIYPVCLTRGRIRFWTATGKHGLSVQGGAFFYLGDRLDVFAERFSIFGPIQVPYRHV